MIDQGFQKGMWHFLPYRKLRRQAHAYTACGTFVRSKARGGVKSSWIYYVSRHSCRAERDGKIFAGYCYIKNQGIKFHE